MEHIFTEMTLILCVATVLAVLFHKLRQPIVLSYIIAGIIIGPLGLIKIQNNDVMVAFGEIGITLLLFILGLELRIKDLRSVGKVALITGIGQVLITAILGWGIGRALGFGANEALYIGLALTFSSTIIVIKLLSDKKDLNSLYGRIAVGVLLIQDFCAILALIFLSSFGASEAAFSYLDIVLVLLKAFLLFGWVILVSRTVLPIFMERISRSDELLFLFSIAWVFGIATLASSPFLGFTIEIGGFLAGIALANSIESYQIIARTRSLRDFFITIFFITLGMKMELANILSILLPAVVVTLFILLIKPLIVTGVLGLMGYRKRTSFLTGLSLGQISEFSLILLFVGHEVGQVSDDVIALISLVGALTFLLSAYAIHNASKLYRFLTPFLSIFQRKHLHEQPIASDILHDHVLLIGANRMGESILEALQKNDDQVLVVDFDPEVIERLQKKKIQSIFGDIADIEIQEQCHIDKARSIISTVPDVEDNLFLLEALRHKNKKALVVVFALEPYEAKLLYKAGADYVVLPHLAGGRHLAKILIDKKHLELIEEYKSKDLAYLTK